MDIQLDCGWNVRASHFTYSATYSGLLEGKPNRSMHERMVSEQQCPGEWGARATHLIYPSEEELTNWLPPAIYKVWLRCSEPIDKKFMGSSLVVIWFGPPPGDRSIQAIIQMGVKSIEWENYAEDFDY